MCRDFALGEVSNLLDRSIDGLGDSDRHLMTIFSIALATRGSTFVELGVRDGRTTLPILLAAELNSGEVFSVDINPISFEPPDRLKRIWRTHQGDAVEFLKNFDTKRKIDFIFIDDWHSYEHVSAELIQIVNN